MTTRSSPQVTDADGAEDVAERAAVNALLRCWVRETGRPVPPSGTLRLDLPLTGTEVHAEVLYHSPAGAHIFGPARLDTGAPVGAVALASLLTMQAASGEDSSRAVTDLAARVADSRQRIAEHLRFRSVYPQDPPGTSPFLAAEQASVLGHPLHPTPKSRIGWTEREAKRFAPELRGSFAPHWFAADRSIISSEGDPEGLLAEFAPPAPEGTVAIPAHPFQATELIDRPEIRALLDNGSLIDLGPSGPEWSPTASVRTVHRVEAPVMLKFSLGLAITNSKRENLRKELRRGVEIDSLLDAGLADRLAERYPDFSIVRDPAWLTVDVPGHEHSGLELVIRANPFGAADRSWCVAGLTAERPARGLSELARVIENLASSTGSSRHDISERWCARYFDEVIAPVLWLYSTYGLGLEAHQQNTVVRLDADGWPCGGWYRDNQGYYLSQRRVDELEAFLPGVGIAGDNRVDDSVIDERLGYYIGVNNLIGLVGAFGAQGLADERGLLDLLRECLAKFGELPMARNLAESTTLRCKANLLTRVNGLDELVGPLETQSVYCDIANPFVHAEVDATA